MAKEFTLSASFPAADQWRLLDLAAVDAELDRLAHRRKSLPEIAELTSIGDRLAALSDRLVGAQTELADLQRAAAKAEADVAQVRERARRDRQLLDSGSVSSAKELANLSHEVESLAKRQADLEDVELEVMEQVEAAAQHERNLAGEQVALLERQTQVGVVCDELLAQIDGDASAANDRRTGLRSGLPADLLALYDKLREQHGVGAARLHRGRCEGCQLELTRADIDRIRASAEDAVVQCEECRRILVRTPDSGL